MMRTPKTFPVLFGTLAIVLAFVVGFFFGDARATRKLVPQGEGHVLGQGGAPGDLSKDVDFAQFWNVWNYAKDEFYKQPVSDKDLYYGALKGVVSGLHDRYSVFFDPEEAKAFTANLEGSFSGIGAEIGAKDDKLVVIAPLAGSPAEKAGLQPGDWIVQIDAKDTTDMSVEEAVSLIRGEKGTDVTLLISRDGLEAATEVKITRDKIVVDSVKWKLDDQRIMRISISTFNHDTPELFSKAVQEILTSNVRGIVIDLRSDPGGLLTSAIDVASSWIGSQPVVIERSKSDAHTFNGVKAPLLTGIPTVILVNGGSASASEIVSGALQDYGFAKLVGTQTFGKGSVQDYRELDDGSAIKVTTAAWYTPKGRSINEKGITPDIEIPFTLEEFKQKKDPQLEVALKVLLGTYDAQKETTQKSAK
ncbi:S41 family peptidase [Candidatus Uhrbacteria bacterium]|nr:S41 family peptidase [Candidatus Uhrbacteria bacterium]